MDGISLDIPPGQLAAFVGPSGAGKTTLLTILAGIQAADEGELSLPRAGVGWVPQQAALYRRLTVEENLETGLQARPDRSRKIPDRIYELFPVLHEMRNRRGGDLSGGQQQQLAIGRALALDPKLLILDEPTEGIQPNIVDMIGRVIKTLNKEEGLTVLLVEQKLHFARATADRFAILDRGSKVAEGEMGELDDTLIKSYLTV